MIKKKKRRLKEDLVIDTGCHQNVKLSYAKIWKVGQPGQATGSKPCCPRTWIYCGISHQKEVKPNFD